MLYVSDNLSWILFAIISVACTFKPIPAKAFLRNWNLGQVEEEEEPKEGEEVPEVNAITILMMVLWFSFN
jgi:hypothetical protein